MLTPNTKIADYQAALALGAELNATGATVLIYDVDNSRVQDNLAQLCELGKQLGLKINIEFMALTPAFNTLADVLKLLADAQQNNLGLGLDLLHLVRAGVTPCDLSEIPHQKIHYVQVCDSPSLAVTSDYAQEAGSHRLAPGTGVLDIESYLSVLPADLAIELEVPQPKDTPAEERVSNLARSAIKYPRLS